MTIRHYVVSEYLSRTTWFKSSKRICRLLDGSPKHTLFG